jgi:transposase-like protein
MLRVLQKQNVEALSVLETEDLEGLSVLETEDFEVLRVLEKENAGIFTSALKEKNGVDISQFLKFKSFEHFFQLLKQDLQERLKKTTWKPFVYKHI